MSKLDKSPRLSAQKKGINYEKLQAEAHGATHVGGPGKPDYTRGNVKGEVKSWAAPVNSAVIKKAAQKGVSEVVSRSGFTKPAIQEAKARGTKLLQGSKVVVPKAARKPKAR